MFAVNKERLVRLGDKLATHKPHEFACALFAIGSLITVAKRLLHWDAENHDCAHTCAFVSSVFLHARAEISTY